jgi:hypothetical protein
MEEYNAFNTQPLEAPTIKCVGPVCGYFLSEKPFRLKKCCKKYKKGKACKSCPNR